MGGGTKRFAIGLTPNNWNIGFYVVNHGEYGYVISFSILPLQFLVRVGGKQ